MPKINYYAKKYIRLSYTDDKDKESNSVTNQRNIINSFITANPDIKDMGEKVDDGYSGIVFDRPAFKELMDEIHEGKINCVIVKDLSRLGREYIETGRYLRRIFPAYGVRFIAINDNIDTAYGTETDDIMVSFKSVINDTYCRDISTKTRSALAAKRENGDYVGACPIYGYRKSEVNKNKLIIDEYPASIVRDIYRMRIEGMSAAGIAKELNRLGVLCPLEYKKDRGLPHPKGGFSDIANAKWSPISIIRILRDETYTGTLIQGKHGTLNYKAKEIYEKPEEEWVCTEKSHQAIVSKIDYDVVQRLTQLDTRTAPGGKRAHLFSGLLICGCCGSIMTRKTVAYKGTKYYYYYCPTGKKNGCEKPVMLKEQVLAGCVLDILKSHINNIASLEQLLAAERTERAKSELVKQYETQIAEKQKRLSEIPNAKTVAYEHLTGGLLSKEQYKLLKSRLIDETKSLQDSILELEIKLDDVINGSNERVRWLKRFQEFESLNELDRRTVVYLVKSIKVKGKDKLEIVFNYLPGFTTIDKVLSLSREQIYGVEEVA